MPQIPWQVTVQDHPGSSATDIEKEPDWASTGSQHRVGLKNRQDRRPGLTHTGDEQVDEPPELTHSSSSEESEVDLSDEAAGKAAKAKFEDLTTRKGKGELLNFRDIITHEPDLHLQQPENKSIGWRYVLDATENWVKYEQNWPVNVERKKKERQAEAEKDNKTGDGVQIVRRDEHKEGEEDQEENDWRRKEDGKQKHHDAYATDSASPEQPTTEYQKLLERYTPQEIALLRSLQVCAMASRVLEVEACPSWDVEVARRRKRLLGQGMQL